jgi:hypothetical protein
MRGRRPSLRAAGGQVVDASPIGTFAVLLDESAASAELHQTAQTAQTARAAQTCEVSVTLPAGGGYFYDVSPTHRRFVLFGHFRILHIQ